MLHLAVCRSLKLTMLSSCKLSWQCSVELKGWKKPCMLCKNSRLDGSSPSGEFSVCSANNTEIGCQDLRSKLVSLQSQYERHMTCCLLWTLLQNHAQAACVAWCLNMFLFSPAIYAWLQYVLLLTQLISAQSNSTNLAVHIKLHCNDIKTLVTEGKNDFVVYNICLPYTDL